MSAPILIGLTDLMLDLQNPRVETQSSQPEAIHAIITEQGDKLIKLAEDIVEHGVNPSESLIVMRHENLPGRFTVLEGNRRVAALKILCEPSLASGTSYGRRFRDLSGRFRIETLSELPCYLVADRKEADHWIQVRHTGERDGAGIVDWQATEIARYLARLGAKGTPALQIMDFVKQGGLLSTEAETAMARRFSITNLSRLLDDPYVRAQLGLTVSKGEVLTEFSSEGFLRGLTKVVEDIALRFIKVSDIDNKELRRRYIDSFDAADLPDLTGPKTDPRPIENSTTAATPPAPRQSKKRSQPLHRNRANLIPASYRLTIKDDRINAVYWELRHLKVDQFPNAAAVLFRVFLELCLDRYLPPTGFTIHQTTKLRDKLGGAAKHIEQTNQMTPQQLLPVTRAVSNQTLLASSITAFNAYVHNPDFSPIPSELKIAWDDLQPFIELISE
jgi:hypothetical protein